jgi:hypothetical protein
LATTAALAEIMGDAGIDTVVDIRNPLDMTPIADATVTAAIARTLLAAPETDTMILGIVPMADRIDTLPAGPGHLVDLTHGDAVAAQLGRLWRATTKPWVCVVDAGSLYAPFADALAAEGIPVVGTADAATRVLAAWCSERAAKQGRRQPV